MAKIDRKTGNVEPFAGGATTGERGTFGDPTGAAGATLDDNVTSQYLGRGWYDVADPNTGKKPKIQDFQALGFTLSQFIAYLHQAGVPEYDAGQEYFKGSLASFNGSIYQSVKDSNTGESLDDGLSWCALSESSKNLLINADLDEVIINQEGFAGGQPAADTYGYDMWLGDPTGTKIRQFVENSRTINAVYSISWDGTGIAEIDGQTLNNGDSFVLNTSTNISVTVPTDAKKVMFNKGLKAKFPEIEELLELPQCQRFFQKSYLQSIPPGTLTQVGMRKIFITGTNFTDSTPLIVEMRVPPAVTFYDTDGAAGFVNVDLVTPGQQLAFTPVPTTNSIQFISSVGGGERSLHFTADARIYS